MKKVYRAPFAELVYLQVEEVLTPSQPVILDPKDGKSPSDPAEEFGSVSIF